jgi:hypothetical protein
MSAPKDWRDLLVLEGEAMLLVAQGLDRYREALSRVTGTNYVPEPATATEWELRILFAGHRMTFDGGFPPVEELVKLPVADLRRIVDELEQMASEMGRAVWKQKGGAILDKLKQRRAQLLSKVFAEYGVPKEKAALMIGERIGHDARTVKRILDGQKKTPTEHLLDAHKRSDKKR